MNAQTSLFSEVYEPKKPKYHTAFYSKADIMKVWNIQDHKQFEKFIGEKGVKILEWRSGKQKFTPRQFRELIALVGLPLLREEFGG